MDGPNRDIVNMEATLWVIVYKLYKSGSQPFKKLKIDILQGLYRMHSKSYYIGQILDLNLLYEHPELQ